MYTTLKEIGRVQAYMLTNIATSIPSITYRIRYERADI